MDQNEKNTAGSTIMNSAETQRMIENHKKTAQHLEAAAKNHHEAATNHEKGNHEAASKSAANAQQFTRLAAAVPQMETSKHGEQPKHEAHPVQDEQTKK